MGLGDGVGRAYVERDCPLEKYCLGAGCLVGADIVDDWDGET